MEIEAGGYRATVEARPITERGEVEKVVEMFREKYGASQIRRYYSRFEESGILVANLARGPRQLRLSP